MTCDERGNTLQLSDQKKQIVTNLYNSGIPEEFIAMHLGLEIPTVIAILRESQVYREATEF
jgi:hypothetical protein